MSGPLDSAVRRNARVGGLLLVLLFALPTVPSARQACASQPITRLGGATSGFTSTPSLSADGRYAAFSSSASDLDGDFVTDVFVYDRLTCTLELISVSSDEVKGTSGSDHPSISDDGRFVAFESSAQNLVSPDANPTYDDVFVRDRTLGLTMLVSVDSSGVQPVIGASTQPQISGSGQFVVFVSATSTLVADDTNAETDIFIRDVVNGTTERVSLTAGGAQGDSSTNQGVSEPAVSEDGRVVAFVSYMTNLVAGDTNSGADVFVRDRLAGTTVRASVTSGGAELFGSTRSPSLTADGLFVFFGAFQNYVPGMTTCSGVFVRDLVLNTTTCPVLNPTSATNAPPANGPVAVSASGRYVAFASGSDFHVPGDTIGTDVFVHDRTTGAIRLASISVQGAPAGLGGATAEIAISNDGLFVAFGSYASNLVPGDTNNQADVFVTRWDQLSSTPAVNVIRDGAFALGLSLWQAFATPDPGYIVTNTSGGVLQFYRVPPPPGTTNQAVVFQATGAQLFPHAPLEARFRLGNSSSARKRISVLIHDADFSDLSVCTFWLAPAAPLRDYIMRTHTTRFWSNATIAFYAATAGSDGGFYRIDNVSLLYEPALDDDAVDCIDPTAPAAPGGATGPTLLTNGDFSAGLPPWTTFGQITWQIANNVLEFVRPSGTPAGVVLQATGQGVALRDILTATMYLGNSSSVRKRVTILLHDGDFTDLAACTFWLKPQLPLSPYIMRTFTTRTWANATISVYPSTVGNDEWMRLDNVELRRTPAHAALGTECLEPGANLLVLQTRGLATLTSRAPTPVAAAASVSKPILSAKLEPGAPTGAAVAAWQRTLDLRHVPEGPVLVELLVFGRRWPAELQVSRDGWTWEEVASLPPADGWTSLTLNLSAYAGAVVGLRLTTGGGP